MTADLWCLALLQAQALATKCVTNGLMYLGMQLVTEKMGFHRSDAHAVCKHTTCVTTLLPLGSSILLVVCIASMSQS